MLQFVSRDDVDSLLVIIEYRSHAAYHRDARQRVHNEFGWLRICNTSTGCIDNEPEPSCGVTC